MSTEKIHIQNDKIRQKATRLSQALDKLEITGVQVNEKTGLSRSTVSQLRKGDLELKKYYALIFEYSFGIRAIWLTHGEGEMFGPEASNRDPEDNKKNIGALEERIDLLQRMVHGLEEDKEEWRRDKVEWRREKERLQAQIEGLQRRPSLEEVGDHTR